jgi:hypothetical protein
VPSDVGKPEMIWKRMPNPQSALNYHDDWGARRRPRPAGRRAGRGLGGATLEVKQPRDNHTVRDEIYGSILRCSQADSGLIPRSVRMPSVERRVAAVTPRAAPPARRATVAHDNRASVEAVARTPTAPPPPAAMPTPPSVPPPSAMPATVPTAPVMPPDALDVLSG